MLAKIGSENGKYMVEFQADARVGFGKCIHFFGVGTRLRTGEVNPLFGFDGGAIGTAVGESLEKVDGGKDRSLWTITQDSLVLGGVSKGLNFVSHTAITIDAYYWMKIALNKETENVIEAGLVGAGSNVYSSIRETMEEKKGKCQYK